MKDIRPIGRQTNCYNSEDDKCDPTCRKFGGDFEAMCPLTDGRDIKELLDEYGMEYGEKIVGTEIWNSDEYKQRRLEWLLEKP